MVLHQMKLLLKFILILKTNYSKITFSLYIIFKNTNLDESAKKYINIINKYLNNHKIYYTSEYDLFIKNGTLDVHYRFYIDKINEFKQLIF